MISGDSKSGDEGDLKDPTIAVDDHFAKLISKKKNQKVRNSAEKDYQFLSLCS